MAADKGHVDIVALLLASDLIDVSIEGRCASHRWNTFHVACWKQRVGVIEVMLQSGRFDPNAPCSTRSTPLGKAAHDSTRRTKKTVLALVTPDQVDLYKECWGWTPFRFAMWRAHPNIGGILLDAGLDPNRRDKDGSTALRMAAMGPTNLPLIKRLIATDGVDVNAVDSKGQTPLMIAASRSCGETPQVIKMLLKVPGIRKDVRRWDGKTVVDMPRVRPEIKQLITGEKPKKPVKRWRLA
jgi:ankyrin repeat protein